nr:hypothetical protein [Tanacetum cinerariifolium]
MSSGSTTTHADNSLSEYDSFLFQIEPDQGELSSVAMKAILGEPHVYVPNVLPTQPTLYQDSDFSSSNDSLGSDSHLLKIEARVDDWTKQRAREASESGAILDNNHKTQNMGKKERASSTHLLLENRKKIEG